MTEFGHKLDDAREREIIASIQAYKQDFIKLCEPLVTELVAIRARRAPPPAIVSGAPEAHMHDVLKLIRRE